MGLGASSQPIPSSTRPSQSVWGMRPSLLTWNCAFPPRTVRNYLEPAPADTCAAWEWFLNARCFSPCRHHHPSGIDFCRGNLSRGKPRGAPQHSQPFQLHPHPSYISQGCPCGSALENLRGLQEQVTLCKPQFVSSQHSEEGKMGGFSAMPWILGGRFDDSTLLPKISHDLFFPNLRSFKNKK